MKISETTTTVEPTTTGNPTTTAEPPIPPATTGEVSILKNMDFSIYDEPDSTHLK